MVSRNEPKSSRKPIRFIPDDAQGLDKAPGNTTPVKATRISSRIVPAMPSTPTSVSRTKPKATPRVGKKALAAAEQERRERYAQELFVELNRVIFRDGLPKETKLSWNKRLLTTAGRAKMHRYDPNFYQDIFHILSALQVQRKGGFYRNRASGEDFRLRW